jgi:CDP-paratose 2-epimerase
MAKRAASEGPVTITGGAGFIGTNLAHRLLSEGERVLIYDNLARDGVGRNLDWLLENHGKRVEIRIADVTDGRELAKAVKSARQVFHFAAQVAVTSSLASPEHDFDVNLKGTFLLLETLRKMQNPPPLVFTSTNKVYGNLENRRLRKNGVRYEPESGEIRTGGIGEKQALRFLSPYGCSKGAADQYVRDYARIYGVPTVVFRMSCIYGTRQFGTEDQGWVAHFGRALYRGEPITLYGDGCQVRDILWIDDLVEAMRLAAARIGEVAGGVFNVGGGAANAVTVREVIERLQEVTGRSVPVATADWRPGDQRVYVSDTARLERALGWRPRTSWKAGLERLAGWLEEARLDAPALAAAA